MPSGEGPDVCAKLVPLLMPSGGGIEAGAVEMPDCWGLLSSQNSKSASVKMLSIPLSMSMRPISLVPHAPLPPPPAIGSTL